ncbi:MAG: hypothetical protein R3B72_39275 [Polyangiaceae bacterium]
MIGTALLVAACQVPELEAERLATTEEALTSTDVDVAPECEGVIDFANQAAFEVLDLYLPSNTANGIIAARPFTTLESLSDVSGVGPFRLTQIHFGATLEGYVTPSCVGIYDELAVSADDETAMVDLVNGISDTELHDVLPYAWNGALNLLAARPFATAEDIAATSGIGAVSFRNIRNAATLTVPFEMLAGEVNDLHREARTLRHFDWWQELQAALWAYDLNGVTCFGVDPSYLPNGSTIRPNLATPAEVYAEVASTVSFANRFNELTVDPTIGLTNLDTQLQGKSFFGCYISYANDPWSGNNLAFFVDTQAGLSVLTETWWSE